MTDVDEEIMDMTMKSLIRELMNAGESAAKSIIQSAFDRAQGFEQHAEILPRVEVRMTRRDFESTCAAACERGIDLRVESWDAEGGPDAEMRASIPASQVDAFTRFWEECIESKLAVSPAEALPALAEKTSPYPACLEEAAEAFKAAGGEFSHTVDEAEGLVTMQISAAPSSNIVQTAVKAASLCGVELDGVGQFEIDKRDFARMKLVADSRGVAIVADGTDRFGKPVQAKDGFVLAKVREADAEGFGLSLASAAEKFGADDPQFAARCKALAAAAPGEFMKGRVLAAPTSSITFDAPILSSFRKEADRAGLSYIAETVGEKAVVEVAARDADEVAAALSRAEGTRDLKERLERFKAESRRKSAPSIDRRMRQATEKSKDEESKGTPDRNRYQERQH